MREDWRITAHSAIRNVTAMLYGLRDSRVPLLAKAVALLPFVYLLWPADLLPDVIPVLGWLDDLAVLPLAAHFWQRRVPPGILSHLLDRAERTLGRRRPDMRTAVFAFIAVWILLAALGGRLLLTRPRQSVPDTVMFERILSGELTTQNTGERNR